MGKTLYDLLEISPTASPEVIKSAYRALAAKLHPDINSSDNGERFKLVSKAYEILSDSAKRAQYDSRILHGEESLFLGINDPLGRKSAETVKRRDGSDTWCTIDEHVRRKGQELAKTNLQGVILRNFSLQEAHLEGTDLGMAEISDVDFQSATLDNSNCRGGLFKRVSFRLVSFSGSTYENCIFNECNFRGSKMTGSIFRGCNFSGSTFENVIAVNADFSDSIFEDVRFSTAVGYNSIDLSQYVRFQRCVFKRCNLSRANFGSYTATVATNKEFNFSPCMIKDSDFSGANLDGASFRGALLVGCNFSGANLASANFTGSYIQTPVSFADATLFAADFSKSNMENLDLRSCNLVNARFHGASRKNVQFPDGFVPPLAAPSPILEHPPTVVDDTGGALSFGWGVAFLIVFLIAIVVGVIAANN